jgi:hypothetical protein
MAGVRGHAARAVRAGGALPGEAHHPRAARGSVRLIARFGADGGARRARERPRSTGVSRRRADAPRAAGRAGAAVTDLVRAANGAVRLKLLRVGAGRDAVGAGRLSHVTGVGRSTGAAGGTGWSVHPAVRRPARRAAGRPALAAGAPSPSRVRRAARPRRDHGAIPRQRLVPKATTADARTPEEHRHQHQSSKHLWSPFAQNRRLQPSPWTPRSGTQARVGVPPARSALLT